MADTSRRSRPKEPCSDCGLVGTDFSHWGPLVPPGKVGDFCGSCFDLRRETRNRGEEPKPLGYLKSPKSV